MGIEEEAEKHLDLEERVTELENLLKQTQDALLKLEERCAPLYSIDIDLLFREFWSLRLKYCAMVTAFNIRANGSGNSKYENAAQDIERTSHAAIGKMTLADDPIEVGRKWYADMKSRMDKLGIDAFIDSPETIFPNTKQDNEV